MHINIIGGKIFYLIVKKGVHKMKKTLQTISLGLLMSLGKANACNFLGDIEQPARRFFGYANTAVSDVLHCLDDETVRENIAESVTAIALPVITEKAKGLALYFFPLIESTPFVENASAYCIRSLTKYSLSKAPEIYDYIFNPQRAQAPEAA